MPTSVFKDQRSEGPFLLRAELVSEAKSKCLAVVQFPSKYLISTVSLPIPPLTCHLPCDLSLYLLRPHPLCPQGHTEETLVLGLGLIRQLYLLTSPCANGGTPPTLGWGVLQEGWGVVC